MPRNLYAPLLAHLAALPAAQDEVVLTLDEIAALVGPLPVSAQTSMVYWRQTTRGVYWRASGWTGRLHARTERVTFTRPPPDTGA